MNKIMLIHPEGNLNNNPNLKGIVEILCEKGYEVDIYSPFLPHADQSNPCKGAKFVLSESKNLLTGITAVIPTEIFQDTDSIQQFLDIDIPFYNLVIGVDRGIIEASLFAKHFNAPYGLISYEILFKDEMGIDFMIHDINAAANISFAVCQDRLRSYHLSNEYNIPREKIIDIPVAGRVSQPMKRSYLLHDKLGIPRDIRLALYMGSIGVESKWTGINEILEYSDNLPDDWALILHHRYAQYNHGLQNQLNRKLKKNVFLSPLPSLPFAELGSLIGAVDIGLSFYLPQPNDFAAGNNIKYIGLASGKTATYIQYGLPVIINEVGEMSTLTKEYNVGKVVNNLSKVPEVLSKIIEEELLNMKKNCPGFFDKELDLQLKVQPLLSKIESLLQYSESDLSFEERIRVGEQEIQNGNYKSARIIFTNILKKVPVNIAALNNLAVIEILENKWEHASELLKNVIDIEPENEVALENIKYLQEQVLLYTSVLKSEELIKDEKYDEARDFLQSLLSDNSDNIDVLNNLAFIEIRNLNYSEAVKYLKHILTIEPENEIALENLYYLKDLIESKSVA